mgnify:CR=1 FL=1
MAKTDHRSIEDYIATFPPDVQETLRRICDTVQEAVPEAEGVISYQIPAYRHHGWIFYVSAAARHYALSCPPPSAVFEAFEAELAPYSLSKSTIRFPKDKPIPFGLIAEMSRFRAKENLARARTRAK